MKTFTFIWTIENISAVTPYRFLRSPIFTGKSLEMTRWQLVMYFFDDNFIVHPHLQDEDDSSMDVELYWDVLFLEANGSKYYKPRSFAIRNKIVRIPFSEDGFVFDRFNDVLTVKFRMWSARCEILKPEVCFGRSRMGRDQHFFVWAIPGFCSLKLGEKRTRLLKSKSERAPETILDLCLTEVDNKEYVSFIINCKKVEELEWMKVKVSLLDSKGAVVHFVNTMKFNYEFLTGDKLTRNLFTLFEKQLLLSNKSLFLLDGVLYLRCELDIYPSFISSKLENDQCLDSLELQNIMSGWDEVATVETNELDSTKLPEKKSELLTK